MTSNSNKLSAVNGVLSMEPLSCPLCQFSCVKNQVLQDHVYNVHTDILLTPEKENKTFKSSVSVSLNNTPPSTSSSSQSNIAGSNPTTSAIPSYTTCPFCDDIYSSDAIENHVESHLLPQPDTSSDESLAAQLEMEERQRSQQQLDQLSKKKVEEMYFQVRKNLFTTQMLHIFKSTPRTKKKLSLLILMDVSLS